MLARLLRGMMAAEVAGARRAASGFMLLVLAALLLLVALIFALMAAVWALMLVMAPWQAALVVAGGALVAAVLLNLWGRARLRSWRQGAAIMPRAASALRGDDNSPGALPAGVDARVLVMAAAVAGIVLGRKLSK